MNIATVKKPSDTCKVCGDCNAKKNYNVLCCPPCHIFFRRNARSDLVRQRIEKREEKKFLSSLKNLVQCVFNGNCQITVKSRGACKYCRLKKCLSVGMQAELLRGQHTKREENKKRKTNTSLPPTISTLDLLNNDRSLLNVEQWPLISYVDNAYDHKSLVTLITNRMTSEVQHPSKIRFKMASKYSEQITSLLYTSIEPFLNKIPEFKSLSTKDQSTIVQRNIRTLGAFGGIIIMRESGLYDNPYYYNAFVEMHGLVTICQAIEIINHTDPNVLLIKLFLCVLTFSSCSDVLEKAPNNTDRMCFDRDLIEGDLTEYFLSPFRGRFNIGE